MKHTIRKGVRADGTVEGHYVETYYTPCKGIATENDGLYLRVVADNGATDIETRVLFSTLESDGWITPNEANNIRAQLAEARKDSERLDWVVKGGEDSFRVVGEKTTWDGKFICYKVWEVYWIDGFDGVGEGKTSRQAIDNAMKGGER